MQSPQIFANIVTDHRRSAIRRLTVGATGFASAAGRLTLDQPGAKMAATTISESAA